MNNSLQNLSNRNLKEKRYCRFWMKGKNRVTCFVTIKTNEVLLFKPLHALQVSEF